MPEWSEESRLDAAFASWEPGPGPDAPAKEREMFVSATRRVQGIETAESAPAAPALTPPEPPRAVETVEATDDLQQAVAAAVDFALFDQEDEDQFSAPAPAVADEAEPVAAISAPAPTPAEAPAAEAAVHAEPAVADASIGAAVWTQDLAESSQAVEAPTEVADPPVRRESWRREDDDVLAGGGRFSIRLPTFRR